MSIKTLDYSMLEQYKGFLNPWYSYKIALGGRGAGRSTAAESGLLYTAETTRTKILCTREFQNSIEESTKSNLEEMIETIGNRKSWKITKSNIIHRKTGSEFIFKGLARNPSKLKSIRNIGIAFVEECEDVTEDSLRKVLMPTVREDGSELWCCGNNKHRTDAVAATFVECDEPPPGTLVMGSNYLANPYCSEKFILEAEHMRKTNPLLYEYIYLGHYLDQGNMRMIKRVNFDDGSTTINRRRDICVIGVDVAREGDDTTVIYVRVGKVIVEAQEYPICDLEILQTALTKLASSYKPDYINVDTTGHGAWAGDALRHMDVEVMDINFAEKPTHPSSWMKYPNKRTEMYGLGDEYFVHGGTIPKGATMLQEELESSWYELDNKNRQRMIKKPIIKEQIGRSPDRSDAFCLTLITHGDDMFRKPDRNAELTRQKRVSSDIIRGGTF